MPAQPFIGQVIPVGFPFAPKGWALCDGQLMPIQQNQYLFALLGKVYGGDGQTTFALPDLRGRAVFGCNFVVPGGESVPRGWIAGSEEVALTLDELPRHTHQLQASTMTGATRGAQPTGHLFGINNSPAASIFGVAGSNEIPLAAGVNVAPVGGNQRHNNMQPFMVINYIIALTGIAPPPR